MDTEKEIHYCIDKILELSKLNENLFQTIKSQGNIIKIIDGQLSAALTDIDSLTQKLNAFIERITYVNSK